MELSSLGHLMVLAAAPLMLRQGAEASSFLDVCPLPLAVLEALVL
jgi:hypothetical protein